jgi:gliding motility-associated-like protein
MIELKCQLNRFNKPRRSFAYFSLLFILFAFNNKITAQIQSTPVANFEMDQVIGCAPFTPVPRNLLSGGGSVTYFFENTVNPDICPDYQADPSCFNGRLVPTEGIEALTEIGVYYIVQLNANAPAGSIVSFIELRVIEPMQPKFDFYTCAGNNLYLNLDFSENEYDGYDIDFGDGSPSMIYNKGESNPEQVHHIYLTSGDFDVTVTGRVAGQSVNCGESVTTISTDIQNTAPEIQVLEVQDVNSVLIEYKELDRRLIHELTIEGIDGSQSIKIALDPANNPTQFLFDDAAYNFRNKPYSISIKTTDFCNNFSEISPDAFTIAAQSSAAYTSTQIQLDFDYLTAIDNLTSIELFENGSSIESFTTETGTAQRFINDCTDLGEYYFQAIFGTAISKSLLLIPDVEGTLVPPAVNITSGELTNLSFQLDFEDALVDVVEYRVFKKDLDGIFQRVGTRNESRYIDSNLRAEQFELCYKVSYEDNCGNISVLSEEMCFDVAFNNAQYPNAFSPNGDGDNDIFKPTQGRFVEFRMVIYNRWGAIIFSSTDPEVGWDGTTNGQEASPGAYVYQVNFTDANNRSFQRTGTLVLIR